MAARTKMCTARRAVKKATNAIMAVVITNAATLKERHAYLDRQGRVLIDVGTRGAMRDLVADEVADAIARDIAALDGSGIGLNGVCGHIAIARSSYSYRIERLALRVLSRMGGATWEVEYPHRMLRRADEGGTHPHRWFAMQEARVAAERLGAEIIEEETA